jgi:polyketide synthase PksN
VKVVIKVLEELASQGIKLYIENGKFNCYAPNGVLTKTLGDKISKHKQEIINLLKSRENNQTSALKDVEANREKEFPLSVGGKGLYILQKINPEMSSFNVPICLKVSQCIDLELLEKSWHHVLDQYPILTAKIIEKEGESFHKLEEKNKIYIQEEQTDFSDDQQQLLFLQDKVRQAFDLNAEPLSRVHLFSQDNKDSILLITIHHIVFDGTSAVNLLNTLFNTYQLLSLENKLPPLMPLLGYHEFVVWEQNMLTSVEGQGHADYWQQELSGELSVFQLLPELPKLNHPIDDGNTIIRELPETLSNWINDFSQSQSLQPSVIFLALFKLLLHKYSGQEDIVVGMPVMGRVGEKFANDIGYFINMIPVRTHFNRDLSLNDYFYDIAGTVMDGLYHSSYPFPLMLEKLKLKQTGKNPVFQVSYAYQNFIPQTSDSTLAQKESLNLEAIAEIHQEADTDLCLEVFESKSSFNVHFQYNSDLYSQETVERLLNHYLILLKAVSENQNLPLHQYSIISEDEKRELVFNYNQTDVDYPKEKCIHHIFAEKVTIHPNKIAAVYQEEKLSYKQLCDRSSVLALYLQSKGVVPDSLVGVCMERSLDMLVSIMGILKAGGAYVPLDPDYPEERLAYMIEDSQVMLVLTQENLVAKLHTIVSNNTQLVSLDKQWCEISAYVEKSINENISLKQLVMPHHLAYVIYTSGSTGKPKGVLIEHQSAVNNLISQENYYSYDCSSTFIFYRSFCFDGAIEEYLLPLVVGAKTVVFIQNQLFDQKLFLNELVKHKVSKANIPPSFLKLIIDKLIEQTETLSLKTIVVGGEKLTGSLARKANEMGIQVVNSYGPTESTIDTMRYKLVDQKSIVDNSIIGKPIANSQVYILDQYGEPQPVGVPGELYISGDGLARGYLNRDDLTKEKFITNTFQHGTKMYKSGDLARWLNDGNIEYLGRIDTQVKIRGFRIETEEIEARLNEHPNIEDSIVITQGKETNKQLIAFYLAKETIEIRVVNLASGELKRHLQQMLPSYMMPAAFVSLAAIPLTRNGKVDRQALESMTVNTESSQLYLAPRNNTEKLVVDIWAEVLILNAKNIGVKDNFFELGGHSLLATQVLSMIRKQFEVDMPLKALFDADNLSDMAEIIIAIQHQKEQSVCENTNNAEDIEFEEISF